jgi:phosphoglycerate kinase
VAYKTLDDLDLAQKRVLVRVDINVPVRDGEVSDDTRIRAIVPTVRDILAQGGRPILLAHFGRPKGRVVAEMSLAVTLPALEAALGVPVRFTGDCVGPEAEAAAASLPPGEVLLCENTRFHPCEEKNTGAFADELARMGDLYVNDAFSAAHRAHASTEGLARRLPAAAGIGGGVDQPSTSGDRGGGRGQGLDQAGTVGQPDRQGRSDRHRRRHG